MERLPSFSQVFEEHVPPERKAEHPEPARGNLWRHMGEGEGEIFGVSRVIKSRGPIHLPAAGAEVEPHRPDAPGREGAGDLDGVP